MHYSPHTKRVYAGTAYSEDGELIVSEEEYEEMARVRQLKSSYRQHFDELRSTKAEVMYCQKLVDQCRQRLIQGERCETTTRVDRASFV